MRSPLARVTETRLAAIGGNSHRQHMVGNSQSVALRHTSALADYVDASIMLSFQRGGSEKLVSMGFAGC